MHALNLDHSPSPSNLWRVPFWLAVFFSPTICMLLLALMSSLLVPAPTEGFAVLMFWLIAVVGLLSPVVSLLACGTAVWRSKMTFGRRVGGLLLTTLAMSFQIGILYVVIVSAVAAAIAPAQ